MVISCYNNESLNRNRQDIFDGTVTKRTPAKYIYPLKASVKTPITQCKSILFNLYVKHIRMD